MKVAWLFPGQGAQKVGMGQDLYETSPAARKVYDAADRALGFAVSELCFRGPESELTLTANTQPALVTTSAAVLAALRERFPGLPKPVCAAGHSLGEYSALVAAGALSLDSAVSLVRLRGQAMQEAVPAGQGAMLAVLGGEPAQVEALCDRARGQDVLSPANFNCPGQVVIAGTAAAIARAQEACKEHRLKGIPLKVSAPFHCALMRTAANKVEAALAEVQLGSMQFPVVANVDARANQDTSRVAALLVEQICSSVRWEQSVQWMAAQGVTHALEIGPGKVLAGLLKKTAPSVSVLSISDASGISQTGDFLGLTG